MRNRKLPWIIIAFLLAILLFIVARYEGTALRDAEKRGGECPCRQTADPEAREAVWSVMEKTITDLPDTPEHYLGLALLVMIAPDTSSELRHEGFQNYLNKSGLYLSEEEKRDFANTMNRGTALERIALLKEVFRRDAEANDLLLSILEDEERISAFLSGSMSTPEDRPNPDPRAP